MGDWEGAGTRNQEGRPSGISAPTLGRRSDSDSDRSESDESDDKESE